MKRWSLSLPRRGARLGATTHLMSPAIRPFAASVQAPFFELATRSAWWSCGPVCVKDYAKLAKVDIPMGADLFDMLYAWCTLHLKLSQDDALAVIYQRIAELNPVTDASNAILEIDEALEVVEEHDVQHFKDEQKHVEQTRQSHSSLFSRYTSRKQAAIAAAKVAAAKAEGPKKKTKKGAVAEPVAPKRTTVPFHMDQAVAKTFLPPGRQSHC